MRRTVAACGMLLVLLGAACGTPATPTADPAQIQASAVAAASTMVAMTEEAAPTPTIEPPTPLPSPTELPSPTPPEVAQLPTLEFQVPTISAPPTTSSAGADQCNGPMPANPAGPRVTVNISNSTKGDVILSLYLSKNDFGECGYRGFNLGPNDTISASDLPRGCYFAGAFVQDPSQKTKAFSPGGLSLCMINGDHFNIVVGADQIRLK